MPLVYTIDNIKVDEYHVDLASRVLTVQYTEMAAGTPVARSVAYFYPIGEEPPDPTPQDYSVPLAKIADLIAIRDDIKTAIMTRLDV